MKKLRFSTFAQVLAVLLCAAMIWAGLYVLDTRANVVWDLTPDLLTELSEGTVQTMDGLDESVHLHLVFKAETESDLRWMLETLAGSYTMGADGFVEFHPAEDAAIQWVLQALYEPVEE